ncbi:Crp/Fnr family transcriptional regulator [Arcobacter sp. LA11]|uniref:Crp/Fnr family transcriptional regulator n=1 Tax=Arcobacter sp. LA11 TaxID=1898176 RepID=UPI0009334D71|nr:Crp/Fnr family transcriptional regulator [Arcobacter sp. LA11]
MELFDYHCFSNLTPKEKEKISKESRKVILPSEQILYYVGDICDDILFLKSGSIKIYIQPKELSSEEMTLYELKSGSQCVVNLFSTISSQPALANAITVTPIEGWLLPRETLLWLIENSSSFREFKMNDVNKRITALINLLTNIKFSNIEQQLLNWLYVQGLDKIKITHENIACIIGVTRETVSRNLKKLEQKGHLKLGRGMIFLD